jgi:hypothetical protein
MNTGNEMKRSIFPRHIFESTGHVSIIPPAFSIKQTGTTQACNKGTFVSKKREEKLG